MLIQQVTQASDRHLQYLGGPSLIAARSLKRANYVVFLELCKITFKIDPVFRQIEISHRLLGELDRVSAAVIAAVRTIV